LEVGAEPSPYGAGAPVEVSALYPPLVARAASGTVASTVAFPDMLIEFVVG